MLDFWISSPPKYKGRVGSRVRFSLSNQSSKDCLSGTLFSEHTLDYLLLVYRVQITHLSVPSCMQPPALTLLIDSDVDK